jgi:elongation factor G
MMRRIWIAMDPLLWIAVTPQTKADQEKLGAGLQNLMTEDPSIGVRTDPFTGTTRIGGVGEHHLEIIVHRLAREFGVHASVGRPEIAYKETVTRAADGEKKVAGIIRGRSEYAHVKIHLFPAERDSGYIFENAIVGGAIPERFIASIDEGIRGALAYGVLGGYPVVDLRAELYDGSYHDVDSSELAFQMAGSLALQNAARQARPTLLEPVMALEVRAPRVSAGPVSDDLRRRRARITRQEVHDDVMILYARAALAEMFGFASDLDSKTAGHASFEMHLDTYEAVRDRGDAGPDALEVPAIPRRPFPSLGSLRAALPEPSTDEP